MFVTRAISVTNFFIAATALGFQVGVLYPWHKQLDADFEALKTEHLRVLSTIRDRTLRDRQDVVAGADKTPAAEGLGIRARLAGAVGWTLGTGPTSVLPSPSAMPLLSAAQLPDLKLPLPAALDAPPTGLGLYLRYALAGAVCCSFTHAVLTPIDVVKTRIQLAPAEYKAGGLFGGLRRVVAHEGAGALATGLGPTITGYFMQGAFKFGGYEFLKRRAVDALGQETASKNRTAVYLGSSALAEIGGDLALCPFEAVRIRLVSQPGFARGMWDGLATMARHEGVRGLYSGLGPIILKQVPYTAATFVVYEHVIEQVYKVVDKATVSGPTLTAINLGSGMVAGVAAAFVSHPADTWLSKVNGQKGQAGEGTLTRLVRIARDAGIRGSFTGLPARLVMVGGMTAVQFGIYGDIKAALGASGGVEI